jgi:hypothetical protein
MSPVFQTIVALAIVAVAAAWLVLRTLVKKKNPGCGNDCGCASQKISATPRRP